MKSTSKIHSSRRWKSVTKSGKPKKAARKKAFASSGGVGVALGNARVLAVAPEGTRILRPRGKPTSFSVSRLKGAIAAAINES
jgi:hypothetical protein